MGLHGAAVFLSAALLFQVQLVIGKRILPWFGGTAAVWTTSMVVFQVLLLLGYAYADAVVTRLAPRRQAQLHGALLLASLVALPAVSSSALREDGTGNPALQVVMLLVATVGLPFFVLGSTTPLVSAWYAMRPEARPYRLYALSNAGSMTGLVSYPFVVEPYLGTRQQSLLWSALYVVFVVLVASAAVRARNGRALPAAVKAGPGTAPRRTAPRLSWLLLPACSSAALLAVTAHLTQNVAPVPLLWVAALAVYLLTFIVAFARTRAVYSRRIVLPLALATVGTLAVSASGSVGGAGGAGGGVAREIVLFLAGLFLACFALHGELAASKPGAAGLTSYYLAISLGGALGSTAFAVVAPLVLPAAADLPVALVAVFATLAAVALPGAAPRRRLAVLAVAVLLAATVTWQLRVELGGARRSVRNFYGSLAVADEGPAGDRNEFRDLRHGVVDHGGQFVAKRRRGEATGYYYPATGVGRLLGAGGDGQGRRVRRVAVVGLGAGTLLSYSRPGEEWVVFEINPRVTELARSEFTFLDDAAGRVEVRHGDGRLELEHDRGGKFDAIVIDAFSGDAVPVHLLTDEAFALYLDRLAPDGVLALHITNKHLDFAPVLRNLAAAHGRRALLVETHGPRERLYDARWVLVANDASVFERPPWRGIGSLLPATPDPRVARWTDDYSNILAVLR